MNTPAHLLLGTAFFARGRGAPLFAAACVGAVLPDLSLYVLAGGSIFLLGLSPQRVFDELYFSTAWQTVFAIDNSFILWGVLLALSVYKSIPWAQALTGAAILHLICDMPLHHDDGRPHFWPLSGWVFESPFSYWDRRHGAQWIAPVEAALASAATVFILLRRPGIRAGAVTLVLLALELWIVRQWLFVFVDPSAGTGG